MRISDWSSDVCSSDLIGNGLHLVHQSLVDMQAACRVEHQHVITLKLRGLHRAAGDFDWLLPLHDGKRRYIRSEERRVGKECVSSVDLGGRRIIKKQMITSTNRKQHTPKEVASR